MEISARFSYDKLDHSKDNTPHLVISLKAPTLDWVQKRPKLCVIPVIDLSGSMKGPKLEYAKQSLDKLVDQLQPGDFTGLVAFESSVHELVPPGEVTPEFKLRMKKAIQALRTMGGTNLHAGASRAIELVQSLDLGPQYLKRAILFTDGEPTEGVTNKDAIIRLVKETRQSVTLSAFGYGVIGGGVYNGCDQEFLVRFSQEAQGNYAYVQNPDDALTAFGRELGGLLSTYAQDIQVDVEPVAGHSVTKAVTDVAIQQNALGEMDFKLANILSEETRNFVFETKLNRQEKFGIRSVNVFSVKVSYSILNESGKREDQTVETKAKIQFVEPGDEQKAPTKEIDEIVAQAQLVRAQLEAEEQAKKGQFDQAAQIMDLYTTSATSRGHNTGRVAQAVRHRLASPAAYATSEGYLRSMAYGGTRAMGLASMDASAAQDLAECNFQLSNSSMTETSRHFTVSGSGVTDLLGSPLASPAPLPNVNSVFAGLDVTVPIPEADVKTPVEPEEA